MTLFFQIRSEKNTVYHFKNMAPSISTLRRNYPDLLLEIPNPTRFRRAALERHNQAIRERRNQAQRIQRANARAVSFLSNFLIILWKIRFQISS